MLEEMPHKEPKKDVKKRMIGNSGTSIAERAELDLLEPAAADAFIRAVEAAEKGGVIFAGRVTPDKVFRNAVASALDAIEARGNLLQRFLLYGPYEGDGPLPPELHGKRLTDWECNQAITLIYSHAINCFKGILAEVFALKNFATLASRLQCEGCLVRTPLIFAGDSAMPLRGKFGVTKGADFHILDESNEQAELLVVGEVKSFPASAQRLKPQLEAHVVGALRGLRLVQNARVTRIVRPVRPSHGVVFFSASPSRWRLPRKFSFLEKDGRTLLHFTAPTAIPDDILEQASPTHWHVTLGISQEFLASQAYSLTYWYMEELGREIFSDSNTSPWPEMTPEDAGCNAVKQSLYYAIRRCTDARSKQRAIALYNVYGFGYALGMSFKDAAGRRQMLWPEQLREIAEKGRTKEGFRLEP